MRRLTRRTTFFLAIVSLGFLATWSAVAAPTAPQFQKSTTISASAMNAAFEDIIGAIEDLEQPITARYTVSNFVLKATSDSAVWTTINFPTMTIDTHSAVVPGTNWAFTAPEDGLYSVSFSTAAAAIGPDSSFGGGLQVVLDRNNVQELGLTTAPDAGSWALSAATTIALKLGDKVSLSARIFDSTPAFDTKLHQGQITIQRIGAGQ